MPLLVTPGTPSLPPHEAEAQRVETTQLLPGVVDGATDDEEGGGGSPNRKKTLIKFGATLVTVLVLGACLMASSTTHVKNTVLFAIGGTMVHNNGVKVKCQDVYMPELTSPVNYYKKTRVCYPDDDQQYPLHFFAHGDFGGGPFLFAYGGLIADIVSQGFVVATYLSCSVDQFCDNGQTSFLEVLKAMEYLETEHGWWDTHIDFLAGYTASGHSTGGRAVLMLAALKDNPTHYLQDVPAIAAQITATQRAGLEKFVAFVGDHPDPMYDSAINPDVKNFAITKTPMMIITGSEDIIEPKLSAWQDFTMITSPYKVYLDMLGARHVSPIFPHTEAPYIGYFSRCFLPKNHADDANADDGCKAIYGTSTVPHSIRNTLSITPVGGRNTGDGKVGYVGCRPKVSDRGGDGTGNVPPEFADYCATTFAPKE